MRFADESIATTVHVLANVYIYIYSGGLDASSGGVFFVGFFIQGIGSSRLFVFRSSDKNQYRHSSR